MMNQYKDSIKEKIQNHGTSKEGSDYREYFEIERIWKDICIPPLNSLYNHFYPKSESDKNHGLSSEKDYSLSHAKENGPIILEKYFQELIKQRLSYVNLFGLYIYNLKIFLIF